MRTTNNVPGAAIQGSVWSWLERFAECVRERDFAGGRALFAVDAHGFGTVVRAWASRAKLEREQWGWVWPRTSGFRFERRGARVECDADGLFAVAMVSWKACNQTAPKKMVFDRRGRATIFLRRETVDTPWVARHSHFSFDPPPRSRVSVARKAKGVK
jgi:hypothetical protein